MKKSKEKTKKSKNKSLKMRTRQKDATSRSTSNSGKRALLYEDGYVPKKRKQRNNDNNAKGKILTNINHAITGRLNKIEANTDGKKKKIIMMTVKHPKAKKVIVMMKMIQQMKKT